MGCRPTARERVPARHRPARALAAALLPLLASCAVRQTVVLVPDPDGRVGRVEVATSAGRQVLDAAGEMTTVRGAASPPSAVTTADPAWVAKTFRGAMAAEPAPPDRFILYFENGTTVLVPGSGTAVAGITAAVARRQAIAVSISGHADATGTDALNDRLARERAERVRSLLLERGVEPGSLNVSSHGRARPAVPTPAGVAEPRNRRVEVMVQ
jgi:outer membrane protein OmpA-like peptidoglycan-associated protein